MDGIYYLNFRIIPCLMKKRNRRLKFFKKHCGKNRRGRPFSCFWIGALTLLKKRVGNGVNRSLPLRGHTNQASGGSKDSVPMANAFSPAPPWGSPHKEKIPAPKCGDFPERSAQTQGLLMF
jgi:hypothetical protein